MRHIYCKFGVKISDVLDSVEFHPSSFGSEPYGKCVSLGNVSETASSGYSSETG